MKPPHEEQEEDGNIYYVPTPVPVAVPVPVPVAAPVHHHSHHVSPVYMHVKEPDHAKYSYREGADRVMEETPYEHKMSKLRGEDHEFWQTGIRDSSY